MAPEERRGERAPPAVAEGMRREGAPAPAPPVLSGAAPTTSGQADGVPEEAMVDMVREGENSETIRDPAKPSAPPGAAVNTVGPAVAACCERAGDALGGAVAGGFARAGRLVASRPWWAIAAALAVAAAMLGGLAFFEQESRQSKLWVPSGTEAQRDKASVERAGFPRPPRVELIIFEQVEDAGDGGPGALRPEVLSALEAFRAELDEISVDVGDGWDGGPFALDDLCVPASTEGGTGCLTPSILDAFPDGPSGWATQADVLAAVNGPFLRSRGFGDALGGVVRDGDGRVVGATALAMQVLLVDDAILLPDNSWSNPPAEAWEARMLETAARADAALAPAGVRVRRFAERTFDDEFGGAVTSDVQLLQIAIVLILAYTGWATTRCEYLRAAAPLPRRGGGLGGLTATQINNRVAAVRRRAPVHGGGRRHRRHWAFVRHGDRRLLLRRPLLQPAHVHRPLPPPGTRSRRPVPAPGRARRLRPGEARAGTGGRRAGALLTLLCCVGGCETGG